MHSLTCQFLLLMTLRAHEPSEFGCVACSCGPLRVNLFRHHGLPQAEVAKDPCPTAHQPTIRPRIHQVRVDKLVCSKATTNGVLQRSSECALDQPPRSVPIVSFKRKGNDSRAIMTYSSHSNGTKWCGWAGENDHHNRGWSTNNVPNASGDIETRALQ